jgi:hypothetical protein
MTKRDFQAKEYAADQQRIYTKYLASFERFFTYLVDSGTTVPYEEFTVDWPEPPQENLFDDTAISAKYLEQIALAMSSQNIRGASYVEDIAYQLDSLGTDYVRIIESRDSALARVKELEKQLNTLLESQLWGVNCKPSAPDWLTKEDRETLLRLSYSLDYVQYATSADFIRSLLARSSPPGPETKEAE